MRKTAGYDCGRKMSHISGNDIKRYTKIVYNSPIDNFYFIGEALRKLLPTYRLVCFCLSELYNGQISQAQLYILRRWFKARQAAISFNSLWTLF
jgi:hypothetical protein